ncbi:MAG: hypothetical protein Q7K35_02950 [bacterium]|nr:hypothetical protein [bacterium]
MLKESAFVKIRIAVPVEAADKIREILGRAGAGQQGNYEHCSSSMKQTGRFLPKPGAQPSVGQIGLPEEVKEELIEIICHRNLVEKIISEVKKFHPYEEPAIDIMPRYDIV